MNRLFLLSSSHFVPPSCRMKWEKISNHRAITTNGDFPNLWKQPYIYPLRPWAISHQGENTVSSCTLHPCAWGARAAHGFDHVLLPTWPPSCLIPSMLFFFPSRGFWDLRKSLHLKSLRWFHKWYYLTLPDPWFSISTIRETGCYCKIHSFENEKKKNQMLII